MLNLIKKDFILQKNLMFVYLIVLALFLSSDFNFSFVIALVSTLILFNSQYYDEKEKAHILINSLPYTRKEIVSSKYIGGLLFTLCLIPIGYVGTFFLGDTVLSSPVRSIIMGFLIVMVVSSFFLPFFYKFTQQYLLIAFSILLALSFFLYSKLSQFIAKHFGEFIAFYEGINDGVLLGSIAAIAISCYALSWMLSIKIYQKKAF